MCTVSLFLSTVTGKGEDILFGERIVKPVVGLRPVDVGLDHSPKTKGINSGSFEPRRRKELEM